MCSEVSSTPGENRAKTLGQQPAGWSYTPSGCKVDGLFADTIWEQVTLNNLVLLQEAETLGVQLISWS